MRDFQLDPNFRTNTNGGPHGRIVPKADTPLVRLDTSRANNLTNR